MTYYTEGEPLDLSDLVAIPHFIITVETDLDGGISKTAALDCVKLVAMGHFGEVRGGQFTRDQAILLRGEKVIAAWEEAAADEFDAAQALADDADDLADYKYEQRRDEGIDE